MDINSLKYNKALFEKKKELEEQLRFINQEIVKMKETCSHVKVVLGHTGLYAYGDTIFEQCLFCREEHLESDVPCINAITYLRNKYGQGS